MDARFWNRFLLALFGGAAVGMAIAAVGRYVFGTDWDIFAGAAWGIMAAVLVLVLYYAANRSRGRRPDED